MTKIIQLPQPAPLDLSLGSALAKRRTNRQCTSEALSDEALAALLWACAGITAEDGRRTVPSTLDLRAVSAYVLRADGAWRFEEVPESMRMLHYVAGGRFHVIGRGFDVHQSR